MVRTMIALEDTYFSMAEKSDQVIKIRRSFNLFSAIKFGNDSYEYMKRFFLKKRFNSFDGK